MMNEEVLHSRMSVTCGYVQKERTWHIEEKGVVQFYVGNNYALLSLESLKDDMKKYNHLPNIKSVIEMQKGGVGIAIFNKKLLQKYRN